jgi:hypothetical protein
MAAIPKGAAISSVTGQRCSTKKLFALEMSQSYPNFGPSAALLTVKHSAGDWRNRI